MNKPRYDTKLIFDISNKLNNAKVYHKLTDNFIITKNLKIKIPAVDDDIAYLTGVIIGDGSVIKSKRKKGGYHYVIKIYSGSIKFLDDINKLIIDLFDHSCKLTKDKRKNSTYNLSIQSAVIFWYFINLGLNFGKKKDLIIPKIFINKPKQILNFIAGLVDTDGHISHNRIQLKQKSKSILEDIKQYLSNFNMNPSLIKINYTDSKPFYYIRFDNKLPLRFKVKPR